MSTRDHGGGLDAAVARWGGARGDWLDLSTGINPVPYPLPPIPPDAWTRLPDRDAEAALVAAARTFWRVPDGAEVIAAPGLSALIARLPQALGVRSVAIPGPTYNEYDAAFAGVARTDRAEATILVHPNNPTGERRALGPTGTSAVDESFCDPDLSESHVARTDRPGTVVLKSFGKFWGLAGVRLGFAILAPGPVADRMRAALGPWAVSGPALAIGTAALRDVAWADATRARLAADAAALDAGLAPHAEPVGGTTLFRLVRTPDAAALAERLARAHILVRTFPYAPDWLRFGVPTASDLDRLNAALDTPL